MVQSEISTLAKRICEAVTFLIEERHYTLAALQDVVGLHKNSVMRIRDLRVDWAVFRINRKGQRELEHATPDAVGERYETDADGKILRDARGKPKIVADEPASLRWLWNPQVDTIEKLEKPLMVAREQGWLEQPPPARKRRAPRKAAPASR